MELIEQNRGLRRMSPRRQAERFPHVHDSKPNARTLLLTEPSVELTHACLRAVRAAKPDRATPNEVAHHNPIGVSLADRYLIDADRFGGRRTRFGELRAHILHFKCLDRVPVEPEFLGDVLYGRLPATSAHVKGKALGIEWIVRQERQLLALHVLAAPALHAPNLDLQVDARVATGEIADTPHAPIIPPEMHTTAIAADRFFERRIRAIMRAFASPNKPRTLVCGRKPWKAYSSWSRRRRFFEFAIQIRCQIHAPYEMSESQYPQRFLLW